MTYTPLPSPTAYDHEGQPVWCPTDWAAFVHTAFRLEAERAARIATENLGTAHDVWSLRETFGGRP